MKLYFSLFKIRVYHGLQYRVAALAGMATQFFWGAIYIMIFMAFYGENDSVNGFTLSQLISYVWLQQAFLAFVALWVRDNELFEMIRSGNIAYELCRPVNIYIFWYAKLLAQRISNAALRFMPILLVAFLIPEPYKLSLPVSLDAFVLFVITLLLGVILNVIISMFIYISVFVTLSPTGSLLLFSVVGEFLSGLVIPLPLMPDWLRTVVEILPFRYVADFPLRIYSGNIPVGEAILSVGMQLFWIVALGLLGNYLMQKSLKHLVVQGG
ncbi:ABC transporter permease [Fusibacter tunisiensis]|uniref:ABC-2 type transport system permease protein n=1 Tax=Fusibacter tunisiensis TaxID=1008308 RepID=A0ABS2MSS4_9FIRM|nr:ABC-2 family transporter protein [Fusibacter tunisiensis]MBM7562478.1 ABC-2 type transport system permease protein [Fusibacter tunisiensis]